MAGPLTIADLDDALLAECYDPGSLMRGRTYASEGRAAVVSSEPGRLRAVCEGSGRATYITTIRWASVGGQPDITDSTCSCPLGGWCKHGVAAILTARSEAARSPSGRLVRSDWRRVLADLPTDDPGTLELARVDLALQLTVEHPRPTRHSIVVGPRIAIRPMRRGKGDRWVKTGASWRDVRSPYAHQLAGAEPNQMAVLRSLATSSRIDVNHTTIDALPLEQFGPDLWHLLDRARHLGVELIGESSTTAVDLSSTPAEIRIDLTADAQGDVTMATFVFVDGQPYALADTAAGLLGSPPHGVWAVEGDTLRLRPFAGPLHPSISRLATSAPLVVPSGDVDELLDRYLPELARHAVVTSADGSVSLTPIALDGIALTVERTALDRAALRWSARYRRGERVTEHRLSSPLGRHRDRSAEVRAIHALDLPTDSLPGFLGPSGRPQDTAVSGSELIALLSEVVPALEATPGLTVEVVGDQPALRESVADPRISLKVTDGDGPRDGNDWFDLDVEVSVDGELIDFVSLFTALNRGDEVMILPSGTWLHLDRPELDQLRDLIEEASGLAEPTAAGVARVNRFQTSWWEELSRLGVVTAQSQCWAESVSRMAALTAPEPVAPPAGLDATLRHYQQEGFEWLVFLHRNRLGGVLADDMGLGKTIQTLALALHILEDQPDARFLVITPTSVIENWAREAARFAPDLRVRTIHQTRARRGTELAAEIGDAQLVVTSYALFRLEFEAYAGLDWELMLLDEAQFVKNHQGKTHQCVRRLDATVKIAITGTPLENTLMDLWSLLSITAPGLYPDPKRFSDTYRKPIESGEAPELLATLRRRIAPLMRRRTKEAVLTELPPKIEQTVEVEMSARHARIYGAQLQRQRQKVLGLVGDVQKHRFEILKSLTVLRQLALAPGLVDDAHQSVGSAKLDRLLDDLSQVVAEGHKALVFSQFTRYLTQVRTRLDDAGIAHSYLDGRTRKRDEAIARFRDGDIPVFVISLKAGGFGLNLTEADYCFVLDPWWNPATETQAVDRAHRMGQTRSVMVYRYVSTDTIEEKVMELKARKAGLFASVMDDGDALAGALTEGDIRGLLDLD